MTSLSLVTPAYAKKLERLGITTVGDLLHHYPRRHEDFTSTVAVCFLQEGAKQTVKVKLDLIRFGRKGVVEAFLSDDSGRMKAMWFNQPYLVKNMQEGDHLVLSGKVVKQRGAGGLV